MDITIRVILDQDFAYVESNLSKIIIFMSNIFLLKIRFTFIQNNMMKVRETWHVLEMHYFGAIFDNRLDKFSAQVCFYCSRENILKLLHYLKCRCFIYEIKLA
jgi:hypothetical protein